MYTSSLVVGLCLSSTSCRSSRKGWKVQRKIRSELTLLKTVEEGLTEGGGTGFNASIKELIKKTVISVRPKVGIVNT